jgi:hypothetical protein
MYKNQYGATSIAARYCGFSKPPYEIDGLWMHGWVWDGILEPEQLFGTYIKNKKTRVFVARKWQENLLVGCGYKNTFSIGLPNVYLNDRRVKKIENSLLVMPGHTIAGMVHNWKEENKYVEFINSLKKDFQTIVVSLNAYDYEMGHWKNTFENVGIKVVSGPFAGLDLLQEQQDRMQTFTHMTTNQVGSHIVYAGALGLKISIAGPYIENSKEVLGGTEFYKNYPHVLDNVILRTSEAYWRTKAPWFFTLPQEASRCTEWAEQEIGYSYKKNPNELKNLFEWSERHRIINQIKYFFGKIKIKKYIISEKTQSIVRKTRNNIQWWEKNWKSRINII